MRKNLYIIGARGFGREVSLVLASWNGFCDQYNIKGFLDDKTDDALIDLDSIKKPMEYGYTLVPDVSDNYKSIYHIYSEGKSETEKLYLRLLLVTDFVCGMTDSYAKRLFQEMNGDF